MHMDSYNLQIAIRVEIKLWVNMLVVIPGSSRKHSVALLHGSSFSAREDVDVSLSKKELNEIMRQKMYDINARKRNDKRK